MGVVEIAGGSLIAVVVFVQGCSRKEWPLRSSNFQVGLQLSMGKKPVELNSGCVVPSNARVCPKLGRDLFFYCEERDC